MKTWVDKLRKISLEKLDNLILFQKRDIEIKQRDLETMERVFNERTESKKEEEQNEG